MEKPSPLAKAIAWLTRLRAERPWVFWCSAVALGAGVLGLLLVVVLILLVWGGAFGELPTRQRIAEVETPEASYLLDRNGELLSRYYAQNREVAELEELPEVLIEALLATEDERFFEHEGIDWRSTARAILLSGLLGQREQGGGSTLTQQLAKNHFPREGGGLFALLLAKVKEAITAARFEAEYSKEELLALYLNSVPFGEDLFGVKVASRRFFGKEPLDLQVEEAAVLVGMLKANSSYHPVWHPERSRQRRNVVLARMAGQGFLSVPEKDSLVQLPLKLDASRARAQANASYLSERLRPDIEELLAQSSTPGAGPQVLNTAGLRVYTTIDREVQRMAEQALETHVADLQRTFTRHWKGRTPRGFTDHLNRAIRGSRRFRSLVAQGASEAEAMTRFGESRMVRFVAHAAEGAGERTTTWKDSVRAELLRLRAGFVVADPDDQAIRAYVGGTDFTAVPFNSASAERQVGSTFKPVVYAAALEEGVRPCDYFANELTTYEAYDDWTPENADGEYGGQYSLVGALVNSVNTVAVQLAFKVGPSAIQALAQRMGLRRVPAEPSIALGTPSLSLEEMVGLYGTFAQGGRVPRYRFITRIETRAGAVLFEAGPPAAGQQVLKPYTASTLDFMLRQVARRGTGRGLYSRYGVQSDVAGKTGTTQHQADGWFAGYTRDLVFAAWVGGAYPDIRWRSLSLGQGARTALPIVGQFVRAYERAYGITRLELPSEELVLETGCADFLEEGENLFEDLSPGDLEAIFRDLFGGRSRESVRLQDRESQGATTPKSRAEIQRRNRERERAREQANRQAAEKRRRQQADRKRVERERKRAARKQKRKRAIDKVLGRQ